MKVVAAVGAVLHLRRSPPPPTAEESTDQDDEAEEPRTPKRPSRRRGEEVWEKDDRWRKREGGGERGDLREMEIVRI